MEPIGRPSRLEVVTSTAGESVSKAPSRASSASAVAKVVRPAASGEIDGIDIGRRGAVRPATNTPETSFADFYRVHAGPIGQALELTLGDRELAEDALNEAMARALQRWKQVAHFANPEGWVYRVAMNWALSWMRRRRRERDRPGPSRAAAELQAPDPDLVRALAQLSVEHRSVVVCRFFLDWSVKQTAQSLDIAPGTVKSRLARALENIRKELEGTS